MPLFLPPVSVLLGAVRAEEGVGGTEDGVCVLGQQLHHPRLVHRVHQARQGGRALGGLQQSRPEY